MAMALVLSGNARAKLSVEVWVDGLLDGWMENGAVGRLWMNTKTNKTKQFKGRNARVKYHAYLHIEVIRCSFNIDVHVVVSLTTLC